MPVGGKLDALILGWLCFFAFALPILAGALQATIWLANRTAKWSEPIPVPKFRRAFLIVTCNTAVQEAMAFLVGVFFLQFLPPQQAAVTVQLIALPAGFFKQSAVFSHMLPTTYARGMLVAFSFYAFLIFAFVSLAFLVALVLFGAFLAGR